MRNSTSTQLPAPLHRCQVCVFVSDRRTDALARSRSRSLRAQHSVFCIEPSSDTNVRSHLYAAVLAGCIPVLFDGARTDNNAPTQWAWRQPWPWNWPTPAHRAHSLDADAALWRILPPTGAPLNYSHFSVVYDWAATLAFSHEPEEWHTLAVLPRLVRLASASSHQKADPADLAELQRLRRGLSLAAPLLHLAPSRCRSDEEPSERSSAQPPCDAFEMLVSALRGIWLGMTPNLT